MPFVPADVASLLDFLGRGNCIVPLKSTADSLRQVVHAVRYISAAMGYPCTYEPAGFLGTEFKITLVTRPRQELVVTMLERNADAKARTVHYTRTEWEDATRGSLPDVDAIFQKAVKDYVATTQQTLLVYLRDKLPMLPQAVFNALMHNPPPLRKKAKLAVDAVFAAYENELDVAQTTIATLQQKTAQQAHVLTFSALADDIIVAMKTLDPTEENALLVDKVHQLVCKRV